VAEGHLIATANRVEALGALFATHSMSLIPQKRIELALEAASHFCRGVGEPFHIECLHGESV
jgi:hypothetical protein